MAELRDDVHLVDIIAETSTATRSRTKLRGFVG